VLAVIPYTTFPSISLGPLHLRTFGLMVALGVLIGSWVAAAYAERFGISRDETYRLATWMVLAGLIGARITWVLTHTDQIHSPVDVIAIWQGGIQFSGGFICALLVGLPFFRRWTRLQRWQVLDGYSLGVAVGLAIGRIGCLSVGEHFGRQSSFFLAVRYDGGSVREPTLGDVPLVKGMTFHNTALYEMIYMLALFLVLGGMVLAAHRKGREVAPATIAGSFILYYGVVRWLSDSLRVNDERVLGMTGAQWMCLVMIPAGLYILLQVRPSLAREVAARAAAAEDGDSEPEPAPDAGVEAAEDEVSSATGAERTTVDDASEDAAADGAAEEAEATVPPTDR
jgi:phosphatidylglycerol---prolipoprotein diacylglyceryl transferase